MKPKKTKRANLENKKWIFFQIGLLTSIGLLLIAFEWKIPVKNESKSTGVNDDKYEEEIIDITPLREKIKEPPKPVYEFVVHDNNDDILSEVPDIQPEIDMNDEIDYTKYLIREDETVDDIFPIWNVEEKPSFGKGGIEAFVAYVQSHVIYSEEARLMGIQGKVYARFVVNKEGRVENIEIIRGVDPLLDNEVIKVLRSSPRWNPGKQRNIPVKVTYTIPVVFKLQYM